MHGGSTLFLHQGSCVTFCRFYPGHMQRTAQSEAVMEKISLLVQNGTISNIKAAVTHFSMSLFCRNNVQHNLKSTGS